MFRLKSLMSVFNSAIRNLVVFLLLLIIFMSKGQVEDKLSLNLKDSDIKSLIEIVSELTGKNFIIDPRVKGKVTIISARPMDSK